MKPTDVSTRDVSENVSRMSRRTSISALDSLCSVSLGFLRVYFRSPESISLPSQSGIKRVKEIRWENSDVGRKVQGIY